jgi:hypothetical protein
MQPGEWILRADNYEVKTVIGTPNQPTIRNDNSGNTWIGGFQAGERAVLVLGNIFGSTYDATVVHTDQRGYYLGKGLGFVLLVYGEFSGADPVWDGPLPLHLVNGNDYGYGSDYGIDIDFGSCVQRVHSGRGAPVCAPTFAPPLPMSLDFSTGQLYRMLRVIYLEEEQGEIACPGFMESRLMVNGRGRVTRGGRGANNVRASYDTSTQLVGQIPEGATFDVIYGPECNERMAFWLVNYDGLIGWTVEGEDDTYWLEPIS